MQQIARIMFSGKGWLSNSRHRRIEVIGKNWLALELRRRFSNARDRRDAEEGQHRL